MKNVIYIKKPGMIINIPGHNPLRTPCKIDLSKFKLDMILCDLRKNGINDYELTTSDGKKFDAEESVLELKEIENKTEKDNRIDQILDEMKDHGEAISKIENLLKKFVESGFVLKEKQDEPQETVGFKKKTKVDEKVDDFIPEINIKNLKIKGSKASEQVIKSKSDVKDNVEKLKNVIKEKE